jgi:hypothetical protein
MRGILQASMALLIMIGGADAAGADICATSVHPEKLRSPTAYSRRDSRRIEKGDVTRRDQIHDVLTEEFRWMWQRVRVCPGVHGSAQW